MTTQEPTSSLVFAALAAAVGAALFGPFVLLIYIVVGSSGPISLTANDLKDFVEIGLLFGAFALPSALVLGLPALFFLRKYARLTIGPVALAGAVVGLVVALVIRWMGLGWDILWLGLVHGALCGCIARLVLKVDLRRNNFSPE